MHIVVINSSLGLGGAERVIATLVNGWAERGHHITLLLYSDGNQKSFFELHPKVCIQALDLAAPSKNWLEVVKNAVKKVRKIRTALQQLKPQAIISFSTETNIITLLATRFLSCPVIVSERSNPNHYPASKLYKLIRHLIYPLADSLVLQTKDVCTYFANFKNVKVIANPLKEFSDPISNSMPSPSQEVLKKPYIVALGRLSVEKGFDDLIEAFAGITKQHPEWSLIIIGEGQDRKRLEQKINDINLKDKIHLIGALKNPEILMREASLFVLSSHFEGFPNALCEAMALGLPVVAYDCQFGPRSLIESEVNGILVPPRDIQKLKRAMQILIQDPETRQQLGTAAKNITARLSLDNILSEWDDVLIKKSVCLPQTEQRFS